MKKFLFLASSGLFSFFISCNSNTAGSSSQGEKNIEACHAINHAIETGDVSKVDQYIAADGVDHSGEQGEVKGIDNLKAEFQKLHNDYKDLKLESLQEAANGDYVFALTRFTGTSTTNTMGAGPGTHFDMTSVHVTKFNADGKATDHWQYVGWDDAMKMMGGAHMEMGNKMDSSMNKMDTTKH